MKSLFTFFALIASSFSLLAAPQAVVFDWGNVIGFSDRDVVVDFMCECLQVSETEFEEANVEKRQAVAVGKSEIDFWQEFAARKSVVLPEDWPTQYCLTLKNSIGADPAIYELIAELKSRGLRVGMLSNIDGRYTKLIREFGFYEPFDPCLLSCEMGLEKPDARAYQLLINTLGLAPADVVFIDDKAENVDAAKAMSIDAIQFHSEGQLRAELRKRGLLP